ncbi:uncharacterized protein GGS22DRAFT_157231 [Annulohypoxylon maeteangense]|uniref:uncharacterized protein n=1 Tax=Annulohypoxylon maeteangense TaxID=1927788 RepID=UPI0020087EAF|nr:uncharacterized protein GGS22DRAFT_157231 [Annulohypoxylon maeteangense]KAI0887469.1 hypothetical protein GGS22DRAFT_157231 [Annulohypoxylon maeteangense]
MPDTSHEEASPTIPQSSRIKRNTACTSCRDAKVRCNPSQNPAQPCQRCAKLRLSCVVDRTHKRVSRKSKLDELVQEIQSIKQSVTGQITASPNQAPAYTQQNETIVPFKESAPPRLGVPSPVSISTGEVGGPTVIASSNATVAPSSVIHTPETPVSIQTPAAGPALSRALGSQPFSGEDIDHYFQKYFEYYHPYMPIVRLRDPNKCYDSSPFLFWTIIYIASRRYAKSPTLFPFLLDAIKKDAFSTINNWPLTLPSINALILLCAWIFPDVRFVNDPSALFTGAVMNAILQLGIHCGKGSHPEYSHGVFQNTFTDEEAAFTWAGYNIISQRVSSSLGLPTIGGLFNQTIQNIIDGRTPFQVPSTFRVLLECQKFCHHVSGTMAACLEESRGVSAHIVLLLENEWNAVRGLICSERADDLDRFNALLVQLEIQTYYMIPLPGYDSEALKRNIMRTYSTAQAVIRSALALDSDTDFLRHVPHFHFRALMAAGGIIYRVLHSSYLQLMDRASAERDAADAVTASRRARVADNDLPTRLGNLFESWCHRLVRGAAVPVFTEEPVSSFSHRLSASVMYDCMTRWKTDHMPGCRNKFQPLNACPCFGSGAAANGQMVNAGTGVGVGGEGAARSETPAILGADALQNIDWTFMDDFDWSFEPVMPGMSAPT